MSGELAELGFSRPADVGVALDEAEAKLFTVAQRQVTDSLAGAPELVHGFLDDLEAVMDSPTDLIGLPTGLGDLDRVLLGLQPSTLNILAARPAMGRPPWRSAWPPTSPGCPISRCCSSPWR